MTSQEIEVYEAPAPATLFGTDDPTEVVAAATRAAKPLAEVVQKQKLFSTISGRKHVLVEGWCLLGSMLGVFPVTVWTRPLENGEGFEARVEARTKHGEVVGAAEAQCDRSERTWKSRDDYALRSMAQTRATSKALRQPLGFVMTLAGFDATPAEEMPRRSTTEQMYAGEIVEDAVIVDPAGKPFPDQARVDEPPTAEYVKATKGMWATISELVDAGRNADDIKTELYAFYGVTSTKQLTLGEVKQATADLKRQLAERKKAA